MYIQFKKIQNQWYSLFLSCLIYTTFFTRIIPIEFLSRPPYDCFVSLFMDVSHESNKTRNITKTKRNEEKEGERVPLTGIFS